MHFVFVPMLRKSSRISVINPLANLGLERRVNQSDAAATIAGTTKPGAINAWAIGQQVVNRNQFRAAAFIIDDGASSRFEHQLAKSFQISLGPVFYPLADPCIFAEEMIRPLTETAGNPADILLVNLRIDIAQPHIL